MKIRFGSFGLGVASGLIVLVLFSGVSHLIRPANAGGAYARGGLGGQNSAANLSRLSQRLGISQDALQKELDSGKTIQQIMQENGASFGGGFGGSGSALRAGTGTGSAVLRAGSGSRPRMNNNPSSSSTSSAS